MKTITENSTNLSKYIFEDSDAIEVNANNIAAPGFIIGDLNVGNATLHESVTPPDDWAGNKYFYDGSTWTLNPNWVEFVVEEGV